MILDVVVSIFALYNCYLDRETGNKKTKKT